MPTASKPSGSSSRTRSGARSSERKGRRPLARPRIRRRELGVMFAAFVAYGSIMAIVLPPRWPLMPFPQPTPVLLAGLIGFGSGALLRRRWAPLLPLTLLVAVNPPGAGFAGDIVVLFLIGPFAGLGILIGMAIGRRLHRLALRRSLKRAGGPARSRGLGHSARSANAA